MAIAGATGFIGRWLIDRLKDDYNIVALSRHLHEPDSDQHIEWRQVDLYSMHITKKALEGVDFAIYLVHSMTPRNRLTQGNFRDTDLILADNFARAAESNGLQQIVYLGGLIPAAKKKELSEHLLSRYEVGKTLASRGTPVTALRAGVIVGPGGSSFTIIENLVRRLPIMICPRWTVSITQPIALENIVNAIVNVMGNQQAFGKSLDLGGPDIMTYTKMMHVVAKCMNKRPLIFVLPFVTPFLSKIWVSLFSGKRIELISPLVDSLKHTMLAEPSELANEAMGRPVSFREATLQALNHKNSVPPIPPMKEAVKEGSTVRSVQRFVVPPGKDATWVAKRYSTWLPRFIRLVRVERPSMNCLFFRAPMLKKALLELTLVSERSTADRRLFYVTGGLLARRIDHGWLEFRQVAGGRYILAAIHDFAPRLPWFLYILTQAPLHLFVMKSFGKYLEGYDGIDQ